MCLAQGPQHSDAGEDRTRGPSFSSQALYHLATALPNTCMNMNTNMNNNINITDNDDNRNSRKPW